jgi:hypothetical protein
MHTIYGHDVSNKPKLVKMLNYALRSKKILIKTIYNYSAFFQPIKTIPKLMSISLERLELELELVPGQNDQSELIDNLSGGKRKTLI